MIVARKQRINALLRNVLRLALFFALGADFRVIHARAVKEVSVCRTGLQRSHSDSGVAQLVSHAMRK